MVKMKKAKKALAVVWFGGGLLILLIVIIQSIFGRYGGNTDQAWAWFLPTIMPTLSLIGGVLVVDLLGRGRKVTYVDSFLFRLTLALSGVYLLIVSLTIFLAPFAPATPLELMRMSNLWLGPMQGLVALSLGAFFVHREPDAPS